MRAVLAFAAAASLAPAVLAPDPAALRAFQAAPVGQRIAALAHVPLLALPLGGDEVAMVLYAPEQGALSRWDDESRVVLYKRATPDWERLQFVSKAGEAVPGRIGELIARDLDGDGLTDLVAIGRAHGPVGKATLIVYRRWEAGGKFYLAFRRRHAAPALTFGPGGKLVYTYETPRRERRFEEFALDGNGHYQATSGDAEAVSLD